MVRATLVCAILLLTGCGPVALLHDAYLGPISPAGRIHAYVVGRDFRVGSQGPMAEKPEALLTPLPPQLLQRMAGLHPLVRGIEAAVGSLSFTIQRTTREGKEPDPAGIDALRLGMSASQTLELLGAPRLWIKRRDGSIMTYSAEALHEIGFRIGLPPGVSNLVPIPGISNLTFRYLESETEASKAILFFDAEGQLTSFATRND